jgi:hypothetical protein
MALSEGGILVIDGGAVADVGASVWCGGRRMFIGILMDVPAISAKRRR